MSMNAFISLLQAIWVRASKGKMNRTDRDALIRTSPSGTLSIAPLDLIMSNRVQKDMARLDDIVGNRPQGSVKDHVQSKEEEVLS